MPLSRSERLLRKAEAALLGAIEIYNKPDFKYREETFSILMLNAWELLLKAKLLADNANNPKCLLVYDSRPTKTGSSTKQYVRKNRSGNPFTKSLGQVIVALDGAPHTKLVNPIKDNIDALVEIRDNSVHYLNVSRDLAKQILEIGTASVRNFVEISRRWFSRDFSRYSLYLLPVGFVSAPTGSGVPTTPNERRLLSYLAKLVHSSEDAGDDDFHVALELDVSLKRVSGGMTTVAVGKGPGTIAVTLSEEDVRREYPWDYQELISRLKVRYPDLKVDREFHAARKALKANPKLVNTRYLDPAKPTSGKKDFYNPNIIAEFDKRYAPPRRRRRSAF